MKFQSTRGGGAVGLDTALARGIAADGGLFVPESLPAFDSGALPAEPTLRQTAAAVLEPFFAGSALAGHLESIVAETLKFEIPVVNLDSDGGFLGLLELHHGPTSAFKDVGAGFLAACLSRLPREGDDALLILVATSGDTGGAVAAAFDERPGIRVAVLFPEGRVSERQEKQLTCWSDNVLSLAVRGSFDDCQALVKQAFADPELRRRFSFSSANSINIGRLLPQSTYYAHTALGHFAKTGRSANFIIPTGNLGNALACIMARDMGLPIGEVVLATNENRLIGDYLAGADWLPRASVRTLATAMDVGHPSNMERLRQMHGDAPVLSAVVSAQSVSDTEIEAQIERQFRRRSLEICPHTATAFAVYESLPAARQSEDWILVATAHAAKFESIVEPLIGKSVTVPAPLAAILERPSSAVTIDPDLEALGGALADAFER